MNDKLQLLNSIFKDLKINAVCVNVSRHRHFAFYDIRLGSGCRLNQITARANEIALHLHSAANPIVKMLRQEGLVRLQLVDGSMETLPLLETRRTAEAPSGTVMPMLLGESDEGAPIWMDAALNPHLLIAGATGSGKSVLLHNLIYNAFMTNRTKVYLVDPKGVEFGCYDDERFGGFIQQVVTGYEETLEMLNWLIETMNLRYSMLKKMNLLSVEQLPDLFHRLLIVIDEVNELMLRDAEDKQKRFEKSVVSLAQKSRAAGIHLVLATQRPSVKVLTGDIKANFPARIACRVSSQIDSRVVLDQPGAELLLGRGDAIIKNQDHDMVRFQVGYISPDQIVGELKRKVVEPTVTSAQV